MLKPVYPLYGQAEATVPVDETNLYVTQLPEAFTEIQLHELFGRFGPIVAAKVVRDQSGSSRCKGFVKFLRKEHACDAMRDLNGSCLYSPTTPLEVRFAGRLPSEVTSARHGPESGAGPIRNRSNPNNRYNPIGGVASHSGPGEVAYAATYATHDPTYATHDPTYATHDHQPDPTAAVRIPPPTDDMIANCFHRSQGWSLYISNLSEEDNELSIYRLFSPFGAISSINAMLDDKTGKSRGFGFVNMPVYDSAFEAARLMHGVQIGPAGKPLSVSFKTNKRNTHRYPSSTGTPA